MLNLKANPNKTVCKYNYFEWNVKTKKKHIVGLSFRTICYISACTFFSLYSIYFYCLLAKRTKCCIKFSTSDHACNSFFHFSALQLPSVMLDEYHTNKSKTYLYFIPQLFQRHHQNRRTLATLALAERTLSVG